MNLPHHSTRRRRRRGAPPMRPLRAFRRGVRAAGLRAHGSPTGRPGTPPRAWLRVRACGSRPPHAGARVRAYGSQAPRCWRSRARLRQPLRVCLRPRRSATALRPSASGAALGPHAPAVCLRRRAQPARSVAPGLSRIPRSARYAPRHSRPSAPRPPLPRRRCRRPRARLARGVVGQDVAASRTSARHREGIPADAPSDARPVSTTCGPSPAREARTRTRVDGRAARRLMADHPAVR